WLARWFRRFYCWRTRPLEEIAAQRFVAYEVGAADKEADVQSPAPIPTIIWAYWNGPQPPLLIQRCFENWRRFNPGFSIFILNDETLPQYLPEVADRLGQIPVAKRSDWIRLELLHRHGGIWLDASTILTES